MKSSNYKEILLELLPQLYHVYDQGDGSLNAFLEAIGETLDDMEMNITELYGDSFIETCHEWIIPYIGQLIGARLLETEGNRNRQEVMKTIHWRKRKGTLNALEDMASEMTGWGVRAAEFFEQLGWSQNLNHIKPDHLQSPDLRDHKALFHLGSSENKILHNIDIREPCGRKGWFRIKNIGFFLSTAILSHYRKAPMRRVFGRPYRFTLESIRFPVNIFDGTNRFPLSKTVAPQDRFHLFGTGRTVDIFSQGILVATPEMPAWKGSPAMAPPHSSLLHLKDTDGLMPVDWRIEGGRPLGYTISPMVLYESNNKAKLKSLGNLDLSVSPLKFTSSFDGSSKENGRLIIRVTPQPGYHRFFPGMVLKLKSHNRIYDVFEGRGDRQKGVYKDRIYCYLPPFCPVPGIMSADFAIDRYGSAYTYRHNGNRKKPDDETLYDFTRLARATEGIIYPSRELTASAVPSLPVYSLARKRPLRVADRGQFLSSFAPAQGWTIKAWNRDNQPGGGILRPLSSVRITCPSDKVIHSLLEMHPCEYPGNLIISLHIETPGWMPQFELIVTDERGRSILVYIPQVDELDAAGAFFYVADDGATYRVNGKTTTDGGIIVERGPEAGPEGAFQKGLLGRYSSGQVLPLPGKTPIRHRIAVRCNPDRGVSVRSGIVAIDPETGHVHFAKGERPRMPLSASYYHGLSASLGAGPYFHQWDSVEEDRIIHVSKKSAPGDHRHLRPPESPGPERKGISKVRIFKTIREAIEEAFTRNLDSSRCKPPWIIQIEDSEIYSETITVNEPIPSGLIIRAAEFQRPVWRGRLIWRAPEEIMTPIMSFHGLTITHSPRISTGRFREIRFKDCTLLRRLIIFKAVKGEKDRYLKLSVENCIHRRRISVNTHCEISIRNCAMDPIGRFALVARRAEVEIERCTIMRMVIVKVLYASESIFMQRVQVINPQKGCVRYCRIPESGNTLPYTYKPTTAPVTFCNDLPWRSDYLKIKRTCNQPVSRWAENGGEIGVYHQAFYTLKKKNLLLKFYEYLPVGLKPVFIDIGYNREVY